MAKIGIHRVSKDSKIEILGHVFNGLTDIKESVGTFCRINGEPWYREPMSPVEGIHVICVYKPYPCFDSEDYAAENRDYSNYFFSTEPFTQQHIERLAKLQSGSNVQIVNEAMPEWAVPAVYYRGEGKDMSVAILG